MPRPTTRIDLLDASAAGYAMLIGLAESLTPEQAEAEFPFEDRDRNVRDVLAHLHEWHVMLLGWYRAGMDGEKPAIPAEGYTWQTLPALNRTIQQKYRDVPLGEVRRLLDASHAEVQELIANQTDPELFEKRRYGWTGTTSLGAYLVSSTSSHYDWALKKLRRYARTLP
ncbi:MAG TPA: ClbS/DfsB family four-helix bundle protein [Propionicimonas sp.]|nr:ClbS/DfsB family four-helix bundle protein [Propionicimonas sp.]